MSSSPRRRPRTFRPGIHAQQHKGRTASAEQLRKWFNEARIQELAARGVYTVTVEKNGHPSPPLADEPTCTPSQLLVYRDSTRQKIAEAHQYVRPDGSLGASGKPDPKAMLHNGVLYYLAPY